MSARPEQITATLGPEYDSPLHKALKAVVKELKGKTVSKLSGVAGSQDVTIWKVEVEGVPLTIESETYMGLTITGEATMVERIAALVRKKVRQA